MVFDCESKISNLALPLAVQKDVIRLDVEVKDVILVQEFETLPIRRFYAADIWRSNFL